jgi:hypothetical protein
LYGTTLSVTYLDEEIRVSRGDRGNLFVLRMHDATKELPRTGDDDEEEEKGVYEA